MITDTALLLIEHGGVGAVGFAALAKQIGLTRQAIQLWVRTKPELITLVTATFYQRWTQWLAERSWGHGALSLLPLTADDVRWTRILLALVEQERVTPELGEVLGTLRADERALLHSVHPELTVEAADHLTVVLWGLREGLCRPLHRQPGDAMGVDEARQHFWDECVRVAGPQAEWLATWAPWGPSHTFACAQASQEQVITPSTNEP
jgi:AcrR family transcriptional regulator